MRVNCQGHPGSLNHVDHRNDQETEAICGQPSEASIVKVTDRITPQYRLLIDSSPFALLATCGPEGLDCSPRGDLPGFVRVHEEKTLMMPATSVR